MHRDRKGWNPNANQSINQWPDFNGGAPDSSACVGVRKMKQGRQCKHKHGFDARSRKRCCHGKRKCIKYSEFVSVALAI